jgi:DNA polymerase I-like protein with 3'-5' exonuclease and polymerase domains
MFTGFRCSGVMSFNDCINYPVQGAAFHCLLFSFIRLDEIIQREQWQSRLIGQVHDSMVSDTHPSELKHVAKTIVRVTCKELPAAWKWINLPLSVDADICDIDAPWSEKHEYELPEVA